MNEFQGGTEIANSSYPVHFTLCEHKKRIFSLFNQNFLKI
jgi:hypothetical protein